MTLQMGQKTTIENVRHYPDATIARLRALLAAGALAHADPHRQDFYELENGSQIFYVHVSPVNGKILLLAAWPKEPAAVVEKAAS